MTIETRNEVLVTCENTPLMELLEHLAKDHAALALELLDEVIRLREELTQWQAAARDMQDIEKNDIPAPKMWQYIDERLTRILEGYRNDL